MLESTGSDTPTTEPVVANDDGPQWVTATGNGGGGSGGQSSNDEENGGTDDTGVEDPEENEEQTEVTELRWGTINMDDPNAEDPVPGAGMVIVAVACEGYSGINLHAMSEQSVWNQDYWFDLGISTGNAYEAWDANQGTYLYDGEIAGNVVVWSECPSDADSRVKLNGFAWRNDTVHWMVKSDQLLSEACVGLVVHEDETWKVCLPESNSSEGGDLVCDPEDNGQGFMPLFTEAFDEAWEQYCEADPNCAFPE